MSAFDSFLRLLSITLVLLLLLLRHSGAEKTAYDVLKDHGLPMGLLPKGVERFTIDSEGKLEVFLGKQCTANFENDVRYEPNVTGTISYGQIADLTGISAQELFLWFPVKGIRVDVPNSGIIYFDVGVIYKQFSLSMFDIPPDCRDSFFPTTTDARQEIPKILLPKRNSGKLRYVFDNEINEKKKKVIL
ncbi:hypothetical protein ZOSMA_288G00360 [Zostera marina]|uniref:DUF538 family protein n=1 Tax=Zostera marina TaxID=29655 RepID=A0A0K9PF40_ZOSMR|nr:hypothetical protein ZOSMA_288G00360 [Zostera marina]